ncbi:MAG: hypothetical protein FWE24_04900 [Defluviitaleaceae bacterium]|nr:hypothetical protein [Defluviitaleaceae bacterium]
MNKELKGIGVIILEGIIIKDDTRYFHTENYLKKRGYVFSELDMQPNSLDFIIFPFMGEVDCHIYNDGYLGSLKKDTIIFSGIRNAYLTDKCTEYGLSYYVLMEDKSVAVKNAVPTSEGVIAYLITNCLDTIANSQVLIIGYGICGKDLAKRLKGLGANVSALVRNREKEWAAYVDSITPIYLEELFDNQPFDIIINTVPYPVLNNEILEKTKGTLLIDIASKPYGFDMEYAKKLNEKSTLLPGIPGKYAIKTAGEILGEYIDCILKERKR